MFLLIKNILKGLIYLIILAFAFYGGYKFFYDNLDVCVLLEARRKTTQNEPPMMEPINTQPTQNETPPTVEQNNNVDQQDFIDEEPVSNSEQDDSYNTPADVISERIEPTVEENWDDLPTNQWPEKEFDPAKSATPLPADDLDNPSEI